MEAVVFQLSGDVEEERLDIVIEGLVIDEQLREKAQVLAVDSENWLLQNNRYLYIIFGKIS